MSERTTAFEELIMAAAQKISARDALERRMSAALNGTQHMVRWSVPAERPGQAAYDSFNVDVKAVEPLILKQYEQTLRAHRQVTEDAINDLIGACKDVDTDG